MNAITSRSTAETGELGFAIGESSLGKFLVAAGDSGIAAILIGDEAEALRRELELALPGVRFTRGEDGLAGIAAAVGAFLDDPAGELDLPLDIGGSALERAVWRALRDIPAGETVTYGRIARALPLRATAQEVGAACAANLLAVAIPCHRVVKADGSISGYRWASLGRGG